MATMEAVRYVTKQGEDYAIRFVEKQTPLRNTWFIFEVKNLSTSTTTEQGISFGRQFMKIIEDKKGFSDKGLCALALLRLEIALERKEPDATANRPRPTVDCGYDLYTTVAEEQPLSMEAETVKFQKMLRRARQNKSEPVAPSQRVGLGYGGIRKARRWAFGS
ncbi:MAG: hypothetical protein HZC54_14805 [Verrucomicrobia bacterium]|nr:hypothetical protein [Verrucomicrobiota bacterium]